MPLPGFLVEELTAHPPTDGSRPRVTTVNGEVLRNRNAADPFRRAAAASVSPADSHEFAAHRASLAVSSGANVKAVRRMLGTRGAAMTLDIYAKLVRTDLTRWRPFDGTRAAAKDQVRTSGRNVYRLSRDGIL